MGRLSKKLTVEATRRVSIKYLKDRGYLNGIKRYGVLSWKNILGDIISSVSFQVHLDGGDEHIRFMYQLVHSEGKEPIDYNVKLSSGNCNYGGKRWWFVCPLILNGKACNRRVSFLYLASDKYLGCRMGCTHTTGHSVSQMLTRCCC